MWSNLLSSPWTLGKYGHTIFHAKFSIWLVNMLVDLFKSSKIKRKSNYSVRQVFSKTNITYSLLHQMCAFEVIPESCRTFKYQYLLVFPNIPWGSHLQTSFCEYILLPYLNSDSVFTEFQLTSNHCSSGCIFSRAIRWTFTF